MYRKHCVLIIAHTPLPLPKNDLAPKVHAHGPGQ